MRYDTVIRNGSVVTPGGVEKVSIAISDGLIAAVEPDISGDAAEEIDAAGLHVLPGLIDAHVHFNEPGRADWEGFATGSAAVAAGGGTCYFDMPLNSSPPTIDGPSFDLKRAAAEGQSVTDFALWGGLVPGNVEMLDELAERGVVGFKAFMCSSGIPDFERADDRTLLDGMARASKFNLPVAVHAENDDLTRRAGNGSGVRDYLNSRPLIAELEAMQRAILLAAETGCSLHIVHVSCGRGVALVEEARLRGVDVTCETCPHYLELSDEDMERLGAVAKCAPPLRSSADRDDLWSRLPQIHLVASDHSPSPPEMKMSDNFFEAWGGVAGCQTTLSILLGHLHRDITLPRLAALTAGAPAERFRLPRKGRIEKEFDADLTLADLNDREVLRKEDLFYRHPVSPYLDRSLPRFVRRTILRGRTIFADGKLTGIRPGRLVRPKARV